MDLFFYPKKENTIVLANSLALLMMLQQLPNLASKNMISDMSISGIYIQGQVLVRM